MASLSTSLAHASLDGAMGPPPPRPTCTFTEHRTALVRILSQAADRVLSLDADRVAYLWNPRTAERIARYELPPDAILNSAFVTAAGELAYVAYASETLYVRTFDGHRVLAEVAAPRRAGITIAACTADLSRVALSINEELIVVTFATGAIKHGGLGGCESQIMSLAAVGSNFYVWHYHVAMGLYPADDKLLLDGETLAQLAKDVEYETLPSTSPFAGASLGAVGNIARVTLRDGQLLPDFVAHERAIRLLTWNPHDSTLLTADEGGTIYRWVLELPNLDASPHHHGRVTRLQFTKDGVVSSTEQEARIWRDGALVATVAMPNVKSLLIDEEADRLLRVTDHEITTYSLRDGALRTTHRVPRSEFMSIPVRSARGHTSVSFRQAYPVRVSGRDRVARLLQEPVHEQPHYLPPIVHDGHLLLAYFMPPSPLRVFALDTLAIVAERPLQVRWMAVHPDGRSLYTMGVADGNIAVWDFPTLAERSRWTVIPGRNVQPVAAVLLARREQIIVATPTLLRRSSIGGGDGAECAVDQGEIEALVADATESRVVALMRDGRSRVIDVDTMQWVEARPGELDAARSARRTWTRSGYSSAFESGDWRIESSLAVSTTAISLVERDRPLRSFFLLPELSDPGVVRAALVDDQRDDLLLLDCSGALRRTSLAHDAPLEPLTEIPGATGAAWLGPSTFAVFETSGTMHVLRTTGERVCTVEGFLAGVDERLVLVSEHGVACPARDGLRVAVIPGRSYVTLADPRTADRPLHAAIAPPFAASLHGNLVLRWDLRTNTCTGSWKALTALSAVDVRADGTVVTGEIGGTVTLLG